MTPLNVQIIHPTWRPLVDRALKAMNQDYLQQLTTYNDWLPGAENIFSAFSQPLEQCNYILLGESPYPRAASANGYAFWDGAVSEIWSDKGLSKQVNRATSLRNFIKMLLVAEGALEANNTKQDNIALLSKKNYIHNLDELFINLHHHGFLLLNASLVLNHDAVRKNAKQWQIFIEVLLEQLQQQRPQIDLILFGKIAEDINRLAIAKQFKQFTAEHPYNISFINNPKVLKFFKPFKLLRKEP